MYLHLHLNNNKFLINYFESIQIYDNVLRNINDFIIIILY